MKRASLILLAIIFISVGLSAATEQMLVKLDSVIAGSDSFEQSKLKRIESLRRRLTSAQGYEQRYMLNSMIFEEFKTYNLDSAMKYVGIGLDMAVEENDNDRIAAERIKMSFVLAAGGLLKEAQEVIETVDPAELQRGLKKEYYSQMMYLLTHLGDYAKTTELGAAYYARSRCYRDSIVALLTPDDSDYPLYMGWYYSGSDNPDKILIMESLKSMLEGRSGEDRDDARAAYILACLSREEGNTDDYLKYLAMAAVSDVTAMNRDIASLEDLARYMYHTGDIDRAYIYLNYALNAAQLYPNRVRTVGLSGLQRLVNAAWLERHQKQEARIRWMLAGVAVLSLVLIVALLTIRRQMKRLRRYSRDLDKSMAQLSSAHDEVAEANRKLNELNSELSRSNAELSEANYVKEEYIGYAFAICSGYISRLKEFKKVVNRKCKAKQFDEIRNMTETPKSTRDEMKDFYHSFDTVFLNIYPTFISEFNSLLEPDARIYPRDGELLNTELRIYALVRLGISDSVKIADFLHCSPQTVYNYRYGVRNKALGDKENFAERVKNLGRREE